MCEAPTGCQGLAVCFASVPPGTPSTALWDKQDLLRFYNEEPEPQSVELSGPG